MAQPGTSDHVCTSTSMPVTSIAGMQIRFGSDLTRAPLLPLPRKRGEQFDYVQTLSIGDENAIYCRLTWQSFTISRVGIAPVTLVIV